MPFQYLIVTSGILYITTGEKTLHEFWERKEDCTFRYSDLPPLEKRSARQKDSNGAVCS